jgi:hypothetical protein
MPSGATGRKGTAAECRNRRRAHWALFAKSPDDRFERSQGIISHREGNRLGIRNARQYRSPGFETLFRNHDFRGWQGLFKAISTVGQAGADELVKTSIDAGINFFDTADNYTDGEGEKILGQSLKTLNIARQDVMIATKVYSRVGPGAE